MVEWIDVTEWTPSTNLNTVINESTKTYNAHFLSGNYYSWPAAMNADISSSEDSVSTNGNQGVCPESWIIPSSPSEADIAASQASWSRLFGVYNITTDSTGSATLQREPFYMYYFGFIEQNRWYQVGSTGGYWSSTLISNSQAYGPFFYDKFASPHNNGNAIFYYGFPIRCVNNPETLTSENLTQTSQGNALISATVSPVISIDATSSMNGEVDFTTIATGTISADISSNQAYQVLLGTSQSTLEQTPVTENTNIPMLTSDQVITSGISQWGIKKLVSSTDYTTSTITENGKTLTVIQSSTPEPTGNNLTTTVNTYSPIGLITLSDQSTIVDDKSETFFNNGTIGSTRILFPIAIAVSPSLPSGKYSTDVTITAVAN